MSLNLSSINKARIQLRIKELNEQLHKVAEEDISDSTKKIMELWQNFDDICHSLSRLDGKMSFTEVKTLSVYDFLSLKRYLRKLHTPKNALNDND